MSDRTIMQMEIHPAIISRNLCRRAWLEMFESLKRIDEANKRAAERFKPHLRTGDTVNIRMPQRFKAI